MISSQIHRHKLIKIGSNFYFCVWLYFIIIDLESNKPQIFQFDYNYKIDILTLHTFINFDKTFHFPAKNIRFWMGYQWLLYVDKVWLISPIKKMSMSRLRENSKESDESF